MPAYSGCKGKDVCDCERRHGRYGIDYGWTPAKRNVDWDLVNCYWIPLSLFFLVGILFNSYIEVDKVEQGTVRSKVTREDVCRKTSFNFVNALDYKVYSVQYVDKFYHTCLKEHGE